MANKYFIVAFLFGLNLWSAISTAIPNSLTSKACHGLGSFEDKCLKTLESAPKNQKGDVNGLSLYTLRLVESNLDVLSTSFKSLSTEDPSAPLAFKDCAKEYTSADKLVKDAINGVSEKAYSEAEKNIGKALANMDRCDKSFNKDQTKKISKDSELLIVFKEGNTDIKNFLSATLNILKASK